MTDLEKIKSEAISSIRAASTRIQIEEVENRLFGRKSGEFTRLMKGLQELPEDKRSAARRVFAPFSQ